MCPCESNQRFSQCCWPYLNGKSLPSTPEQLMRSRYSAYSRGNIAYIQATQAGPAGKDFDPIDAKQRALATKWLGLSIIRTELGTANEEIGYVEFIARYKINGQVAQLHEVSEFHKIHGRWIYYSGILK